MAGDGGSSLVVASFQLGCHNDFALRRTPSLGQYVEGEEGAIKLRARARTCCIYSTPNADIAMFAPDAHRLIKLNDA